LLKNKVLINFFSSGLQAFAVQILGSIFFYLISVYLTKENFGLISWMNAVSFFLTTLLGFGMEQVVVRRIAASNRSDWAAAAFFIHALSGSLITLLILLVLNALVGSHSVVYQLLPWFFGAQALLFIGIPLKQFLNAKEEFRPYGIIAVFSNICKIAAAYVLLQTHMLDTYTVIIVLICTAGFELGCLLIYIVTKTTFNFKLHFKAYIKLIKESSAQYLSVIFDMSLSRMDWILLGIMTTNVVLADYSFAYRAYELSRLPMLIIAPLILPRFSRMMASKSKPGALQQYYINAFGTVEMFFAVMIPLTLNILWEPVVILITKGKYGSANSLQFLILSLCIPLQFFINLLWSLSFGAKKYRSVTTITVICAITNVVLNLVLISKFNGLGAAVAFLITTLLQGYLYYKLVSKEIMKITLRPVIIFVASAAAIYFITIHINVNFVVQMVIAVSLYVAVAVLSKQINKQHIYNFKHFLSK
jgi:O-antigen/teichoic acid export membrane protein